jgi:flavin reductase
MRGFCRRDNVAAVTVAPDEYRAVMRAFPTGVAVVAVDAAGARLGLTVGSLASLSLEPPLVGVAIGRDAAMHELLREAGSFGVSLLAGDQDGLAQHFARGVPPIALWHGIAWRPGEATGSPLLDGAVGWLECRLMAENPAGDHTNFVGEVVAAEPGRSGPGLVYVGSAYRPGP